MIAIPKPPVLMLDYLFKTFVTLFLLCTNLIILIFPVRQTHPLNFSTASTILAHFLFLNHFHLIILNPFKPPLFALFKTIPIPLQHQISNFYNLHIHLTSFLYFSFLSISSLNFIFYNSKNTFFFSLVSPSCLFPTSQSQTSIPFIHDKIFFIFQNHPT